MATATSLKMSADAASAARTADSAIDAAIAAVKASAPGFARLPVADKARLLRACIERTMACADEWAATGARARGASEGEEWLAGISPTVRGFRLLAESLEAIAAKGKPALGTGTHVGPGGRLAVDLFPASHLDKATFAGFTGYALMQDGVDRAAAVVQQAAFYDQVDPAGGVSLILGAGNVASIPPLDAASKLFVEGFTCIIKVNPVNEWVGPYLERALAPLIDRDYVRIVYGGADVGKYLCEHADIDDIHITGSDRTHDLIVWGPPGAERDRRLKANDPVLKIPISSELGNVSPVAIVPYTYSDEELWFQARNVVTMVWNNGSFNCNAAKLLITSARWPQRRRFLDMVARGLASVPTRKAYYPGAFDRYEALTSGRDDLQGNVQKIGTAREGHLQWALIEGLDASDESEPLFRTEPFCGVLSETSLESADPAVFLDKATAFMNDRVWGTLNAMIVIHPQLERDPVVGPALERAIVQLRYGTVGINHWPALGYAFGTTPWGGHASATLQNIQSGLGWVHNSFMLDGIDKAVVRGNLVVKPTPAWFFDNTKVDDLAPRVAKMEADPSWLKLPGLMLTALL